MTNRDTAAVVGGLSGEAVAVFEYHRNDIRKAYLRAVEATVTVADGFTVFDDRFFDTMDVALSSLFVRAGALDANEMFAVSPVNPETQLSFYKSLDSEARAARHAADHFRDKLKAIGLDPYEDGPVTSDTLERLARDAAKREAMTAAGFEKIPSVYQIDTEHGTFVSRFSWPETALYWTIDQLRFFAETGVAPIVTSPIAPTQPYTYVAPSPAVKIPDNNVASSPEIADPKTRDPEIVKGSSDKSGQPDPGRTAKAPTPRNSI